MIFKIAQHLLTSRTLILRDPEKFMAFLVPLGKDPEVRRFKQLHGIIVDITSYILSQERFARNIKNTTDIIIKVRSDILFHSENCLKFFRHCSELSKLR